jgi:hypothetical protein
MARLVVFETTLSDGRGGLSTGALMPQMVRETPGLRLDPGASLCARAAVVRRAVNSALKAGWQYVHANEPCWSVHASGLPHVDRQNG